MLNVSPRLAVLVGVLSVMAVACSKDPEVLKKQYFDSGNRYFDQGKFKEAIVEYRNAVQQDARFGEARLKLADAYLKENDARNAYREYVRAADLLPNNAEAQRKAAGILLLAQQFEDAKTRAERAVQLDPTNVDAQVLRANALAGLKDFDAAVKDLEQAIRLDPKQALSYSNLGAMQQAKGNNAEAEAAFRKAIETDPKSVPARLAFANFKWSLGQQAEAEAELKAALELDPKNDLANRALATFYMAGGRVKEVEPYLKALADNAKEGAPKLALADYYIATNRSADALTLLEQVSKDPASWAGAQARIAALAYSQGEKEKAYKTIDAVLAKEPKNVQVILVKARLLMSDGKADEALPLAKEAATADATNPEVQYFLGTILIAKNDIEGAIAAMNEVVRLNPRAAAAQVQLSRLELQRGAAATSVQYAEQAVNAAPTNPIVRLTLARSLMAKGEYARAESEMKALLEHYPKAASVHAQYGLLLLLQKNIAGAKKSFDQAIALDPNDFDAFRGLIGVDLANHQYDQIQQKLDARLAKNPNDPNILILAGRTYGATGNFDKAEANLRKVVEVDPSRVEAYSMLGQLYLTQKKLDQAVTEFETLAKRQPTNVGPPTMVAMILQMQGRDNLAQKRYEEIMLVNPRAAVAANNLAWIYAERGGNLDVALQLAQTAKERLPDSPEVDDTLGFVYLKKDLASLAVPPLQSAIEKDPQNPTYRYRLGLAYAKLGKKDDARRELEQALKLRPDFPEAAAARQTLADLGRT